MSLPISNETSSLNDWTSVENNPKAVIVLSGLWALVFAKSCYRAHLNLKKKKISQDSNLKPAELKKVYRFQRFVNSCFCLTSLLVMTTTLYNQFTVEKG